MASIFTWCMLQTCKLCHRKILSLSMPMILHYSSANKVQLTCNRNMITSVPGLPETGLSLILIKQNKLFFPSLPQNILIFRSLYQTLNELHRPHYRDLISLLHFLSRVCTVVHYAVLEAIHAVHVYGIWQISPLCK